MSDNANNTEKYPRPPFVDQPQSPPGLAEEMKPQPDHGELSYVGSGRLAGKRALITGGDSGIGRAVAIAFAREGADVAINYLPEEESDAETVVALIQAEGRKAVAIPGDVRDESFCETLVEQAASELGGWIFWSITPDASNIANHWKNSPPPTLTPPSKPTFMRPSGSPKPPCVILKNTARLLILHPSRPLSRAPSCWTMRKPKPAWWRSRNRWPNSWGRRVSG